MAFQFSPFGNDQFLNSNGALAVGYQLFTYLAGTTTKTPTYTDVNGITQQTNPIILNAIGLPPASIFLDKALAYKFVFTSPTDTDPPVSPIYTADNIAVGTAITQGGNLTGGINYARTSIASSTTPDIFAVTVGNTIDYTGTATCTGFIAAPQAGPQRILVCAAAAVFTAGANLLIDGVASGSNYQAAVGDKLMVIAITTTQFRMTPWRGSGAAVTNLFTPMHIQGLIPSNNGINPTNDMDFSSGSCIDATGLEPMVSPVSVTKQSNVAWAVGTAAGMLDTGAVGDNDYYVWQIKRQDINVVDKLSSLSSTAPTMPANYTVKRLIGWFKRVGGTIVAFHAYEVAGGGLEVSWDVPTLDVNLAVTLTTVRRTDAVKVPLNFSVLARLSIYITDASNAWDVKISCPDVADAAVVNQTATANWTGDAAGRALQHVWIIRTSATGLIAARHGGPGTIDRYQVTTEGFTWARRN